MQPHPQINRRLSALLLALALSGCVAASRPDLQPIPPPVQVRLVYQPIDSGLLTCKKPALVDPDATDLDLVGALNRVWDAWADCAGKLAAIARLQNGPQSRFNSVL